jgi:hypothetical protein
MRRTVYENEYIVHGLASKMALLRKTEATDMKP